MRLVIILLILAFAPSGFTQSTASRISPLALATSHYKDTYIKIIYSQPQKKNREVFGKLVPYGKVWRTGANEATEITLTKDVIIDGKPVKAGTYSLFTIPDKDQWSIILNGEVGLWGSYNYNPKSDVEHWESPVIPIADAVYESFTITLDQKNDKANLILAWDRVSVKLQIQFIEPKP